MPKIAIYKYLTFFFFTYDLQERMHIHISNDKDFTNYSKIWLDTYEIAEKGKLTEKDLNLCIRLLKKNSQMIIESIENFRNLRKSKVIELKL